MLNLLNLNLLNIATFLWLAFWAFRAFKCLAAGSRYSILFVILIHFVFSGVPLLLDVIFGKPEYSLFPGFYLASRDNTTSIIYCLYVSAVPIIWWLTGRGKRLIDDNSLDNTINTAAFVQRMKPAIQLILFIFMLSPLFAWMYSPEPEVYFRYGAAVNDLFRFEAATKYHGDFMSLACFLSLLGVTGFLALQERIDILLIAFLLPWIILVFWLNSKRGIVAFAIILIGYVFWQKGYLKGVRFVWAIILAVAIILSFSYFYQLQVRDISAESTDPVEFYDGIRIDYGRDAEIKMAIFAELYPEKMQILEYRGQSIVFNLTMVVPRAIWSEKPMAYAQYVTTTALMLPPTREMDWFVTTSWLEEAIANFSWVGMILGPILLSIICRLGDARKNVIVNSLTVLIGCLFLTVQLSAFWPLFYFWLLGVILLHPEKRKKHDILRNH